MFHCDGAHSLPYLAFIIALLIGHAELVDSVTQSCYDVSVKIVASVCDARLSSERVKVNPNQDLELDLSRCSLLSLPNFPLRDCHLTKLNLSHNTIPRFPSDGFVNASKLASLDISSNPFCYNNLSADLFAGLTNLQDLFMQSHGKAECLRVNEDQFRNQTKLRQLHVFGSRPLSYLHNLPTLEWLNLGISGISSYTLRNSSDLQPLTQMRRLTRLSLRGCVSLSLNPSRTLPNTLTHLDVSYTGVKYHRNILANLNPNIRVLLIDGLRNLSSTSHCNAPITQFNLTTLSVNDYHNDVNKRFIFGESTILCGDRGHPLGVGLPFLRYLSTYQVSVTQSELVGKLLNETHSQLRSLEFIDVSEMTSIRIKDGKNLLAPTFDIFDNNSDYHVMPDSSHPQITSISTNDSNAFPLLPKLIKLTMTKLSVNPLVYSQTTGCRINPRNSLVYIDQSNPTSKLKSCVYSGLTRVRAYTCHSCKDADLTAIGNSFPHLTNLSVSQASLSGSYLKSNNLEIAQLEYTSSNSSQLKSVLDNLNQVPNLQVLNLSYPKGGELTQLNVNFLPTNICIMDLTHHSISSISPTTRQEMTKHASRLPAFRLYLNENGLITCNCDHAAWVQWLVESSFVVHNYKCEEKKNVTFYESCKPAPPADFYWVVGIVLAFLLIVVIISILNRNSTTCWKIKRFVFTRILSSTAFEMRDSRPRNSYFLIFLDDGDLTWALTDYAFRKPELELSVFSRLDVGLGDVGLEAVVKLIDKSRYVLVLVPKTYKMIDSKQALSEFHLAQHSNLPNDLNVTIACVSPEDCDIETITEGLDQISERMLRSKHLTILPESHDITEEVCAHFWTQVLSSDLQNFDDLQRT